MKLTIRLFTLITIATLCAVPILAQSKECTDENKSAWYDTFLKNYKGEPPQQKVAYDAAKLYLACPNDPNDAYAKFLQKFVGLYEDAGKKQDTAKQFADAVTKHNYPDQMRLGQELLKNDPDNPGVNIVLGISGVFNSSLLAQSQPYAKKAIELVEAGKPPAPMATKDQALAYLNWDLGKSMLSSAPADALPYLLKAAKYESEAKKDRLLYLDIAEAYQDGPRAKLQEDYKAKTPNNTETPESKLVLENLNQIIDRQIDAWARAAALTTNANDKKALMDELTGLYKYRNKSDTGLNELIASVLSKPIPEIPTPITSLPTTPASTGTPTNGGASGPNGAPGSKPTGNDSSSTGSGSAKAGTSGSPNKKPRS